MPRTKKMDDSVVLKMILEVIIKQGATIFSLEDLSQRTGLSPATLLQRFGSKKDILHKAIELANQELKENLSKKSLRQKSPLQELLEIYIGFAQAFTKPKQVALGLDILKLDIIEPQLNQLTRTYFEIRRDKIQSLLAKAQDKGEISKNLEIKDLTWNLESLWQGSIMLWALIGEGKLDIWLKDRLLSYLKAYRE